MSYVEPEPKKLNFRSIITISVFTVGLSWVISQFILGMFYIPSVSMEPTLNVNDRVLVSKVTHYLTPVKYGDIIVFKDPGGWLNDNENISEDDVLIKRVIGVEGDIISNNGDGYIRINGTPILEQYVSYNDNVVFEAVVPEDSYFVMGDNRVNSYDSRTQDTQFVKKTDIVGVMFYVIKTY
jgi:signal peptidase I